MLLSDPAQNITTLNFLSYSDEHALRLDAVLSEARKLASGLLKKWNLGRCNESILILFSRDDNVVCIKDSAIYLNP